MFNMYKNKECGFTGNVIMFYIIITTTTDYVYMFIPVPRLNKYSKIFI